jgi:hypothetical protein
MDGVNIKDSFYIQMLTPKLNPNPNVSNSDKTKIN